MIMNIDLGIIWLEIIMHIKKSKIIVWVIITKEHESHQMLKEVLRFQNEYGSFKVKVWHVFGTHQGSEQNENVTCI